MNLKSENSPKRIAVLVNLNAGQATPEKLETIRSLVDPKSVFTTRQVEELPQTLSKILDFAPDVLCIAGGDGTFTKTVTELLSLDPQKIPVLFPLNMGSGNAIASTFGASLPTPKGLASDIDYVRTAHRSFALRLLKVKNELTQFAGIGLDGQASADFNRYRQYFHHPLIRRLCRPGVILAAGIRTAFRRTFEAFSKVKIINTGETAYRLDEKGKSIGNGIQKGETLYEGDLSFAAASTIASYSRGFKIFPFIERWPDRFQLRISKLSVFDVLSHVREFTAGTYRNSKRLFDFVASSVEILLDQETAFHIGGDPAGKTHSFKIELAPQRLQLLKRPLFRSDHFLESLRTVTS